jgi:hypothetical protein
MMKCGRNRSVMWFEIIMRVGGGLLIWICLYFVHTLHSCMLVCAIRIHQSLAFGGACWCVNLGNSRPSSHTWSTCNVAAAKADVFWKKWYYCENIIFSKNISFSCGNTIIKDAESDKPTLMSIKSELTTITSHPETSCHNIKWDFCTIMGPSPEKATKWHKSYRVHWHLIFQHILYH